MRSSFFIIFLLFCVSGFSQSYEAPILHCLQVDAADDVTLTWVAPDDPLSSFVEYRLWRSETFFEDNFAVIPDITTLSFLDLAASANESERYYIQAVYDSSGVELIRASDTLRTMNPSANGFGNRVEMTWNYPIMGALDTIYTSFVFQLNYSGTWQSVDTLPYSVNSYEYFTEICPEPPALDVDIDFRILLLNEFGCTSVSVQRDDVTPLFDNNPPTPPQIETVTVDTALQRAVICWFPSPEGDVQGYRVLNVLEEEIGLTNDPAITSLTDNISNIVLNSQGYLVVARDTCGGNETSADDGVPHFTINLDLEFLKCDQSTRMEWNAYQNWDGGVSGYVIYGGLNGNVLQVIDTVPGDQTTYLHENVPLEVDYTYMIKALATNGYKPSLSPRTAVFTSYPDLPSFTYLANVSVLGPQAVELKALIDPAAEGTRYRFERLDVFGDDFDVLATFVQEQVDPDGFLTAIDFDARPADRIYEYRLSVIDSCGNVSSYSEISSNIKASVTPNSSLRENYISWNDYQNWDGGVLQYNIYQVIDGLIGPLLGSVPSNTLYYIDDVDSIQDYIRNGQYCYIIEAVEGLNSYNASQSSFSNVICGTQEPLIFIPNAITPNGDGLNDTFSPVAGYFDRVEGYSLVIYDRWGGVVFETDDYYRHWRAEDGNGMVQEGVFVYHLRLRTGDGLLYERYGDITVLFPDSE